MNIGLQDKVIVVTGAASGIGKSVAQEAARAEAGALFLTDVDLAGCVVTASSLDGEVRIKTHAANLTDPVAARGVIAAAVATFGRVDCLVNAAGLTTRGAFIDGTVEIWDELFAVNARAPFLLMQCAINDMLARSAGGSIVNIQSVNAHCGVPELAIYSASKGALQTLTKNAANAHISDGIRVNGINLGWTLTEAEHQMQGEVLGKGVDWAAQAAQHLPLGRLIQPEEAARLTVFMLSDASAPLTGAVPELDQKVLGAMW